MAKPPEKKRYPGHFSFRGFNLIGRAVASAGAGAGMLRLPLCAPGCGLVPGMTGRLRPGLRITPFPRPPQLGAMPYNDAALAAKGARASVPGAPH